MDLQESECGVMDWIKLGFDQYPVVCASLASHKPSQSQRHSPQALMTLMCVFLSSWRH